MHGNLSQRSFSWLLHAIAHMQCLPQKHLELIAAYWLSGTSMMAHTFRAGLMMTPPGLPGVQVRRRRAVPGAALQGWPGMGRALLRGGAPRALQGGRWAHAAAAAAGRLRIQVRPARVLVWAPFALCSCCCCCWLWWCRAPGGSAAAVVHDAASSAGCMRCRWRQHCARCCALSAPLPSVSCWLCRQSSRMKLSCIADAGGYTCCSE